MPPVDTINEAFRLLITDSSDSMELWKTFYGNLQAHYDEFSASLGRHVPEESIVHLLALLLVPIARNGFVNSARRERLFEAGEQMGTHVLPVHFYSPLPDTENLPPNLWTNRFDGPGWDLNVEDQLALLRELAPYAEELKGVPVISDTDFSWRNPAITPTDAALYYCIIRHFRPRRVIEVGAGYSTLMAAAACRLNGDTELIAIDPYPHPLVKAGVPGLERLLSTPVQDIDPKFLAQLLKPSDILFIDSTHVSKVHSDVNHLILRVLPRLESGVIIHFHDIFLPMDYPQTWVKEKHIFWNEQYLLLAFLLFNNRFKILLTNQYLGLQHGDLLQEMFPMFPEDMAPGGGSFWLRGVSSD